MPLYDFVCRSCKMKFEAFAFVNEIKSCERCGEANCLRLIPTPHINRSGYKSHLKKQTQAKDLENKMLDRQKDNLKMIQPKKRRALMGGFEKVAVKGTHET